MGEYDFVASATPGSPLSYQSLLTRRKIAEALLGKRTALPFPKNLGEGLTYASEKLANAYTDRSRLEELDKGERAYEAETLQQAKDAAKQLYGTAPPASTGDQRSDTGADASTSQAASGVPGVPYEPSSPGAVPLPPRRPAMDYSRMAAEVDADPALIPTMAKMVQGEVPPNASLQQRQIQAQSAFNRAQANGLPLRTALSNGYYPPETFSRGTGDVGAFKRDVLDPVLRGADPSSEAFNFPASQNASGDVARHGIQTGRYSPYAAMGGETYGQKRGEGAALERFRTPFGPPAVPGAEVADETSPTDPDQVRNAITRQLVSPPSPAAPGVQVASLGNGGSLGNAAAASSVIPPVLPPGGATPPVSVPAPPNLAPGPGPTAALPSPPANAPPPVVPTPPNVQPDIMTRPVQTAQAQLPAVPPQTGAVIPQLPANMPPGYEMPKPIPPDKPKQTPATQAEQEATIRAMGTADPNRQAMWNGVAAQLAKQREFTDARNVKAWEFGMQQYGTLYKMWEEQEAAKQDKALATNTAAQNLAVLPRRLEAEATKRDIENVEAKQKAEEGARTAAFQTQMGGVPKETADAVREHYVKTLKPAVEVLAKAQPAIRQARLALSQGAITGVGADAQINWSRLMGLMGLADQGSDAANSQYFKTILQPVVNAQRVAAAGNNNISDADIRNAQAAAGADFRLEPKALHAILDTLEDNTVEAVKDYKAKSSVLFGTEKHPALEAAFGAPRVDLEDQKLPAPKGPVHVFSERQAKRYPSGTIIITPNGDHRKVP